MIASAKKLSDSTVSPTNQAHLITAAPGPFRSTQPVASRISTTIHSPGGLLGKHGASAPSMPFGCAPSDPPLRSADRCTASPTDRPRTVALQRPPLDLSIRCLAPISRHGPGGPGNNMSGPQWLQCHARGPLQQQQPPQGAALGSMQHDGARAMQQMPFGGGGGVGGHPVAAGPGAAASRASSQS